LPNVIGKREEWDDLRSVSPPGLGSGRSGFTEKELQEAMKALMDENVIRACNLPWKKENRQQAIGSALVALQSPGSRLRSKTE
jgi:hypothetical protein